MSEFMQLSRGMTLGMSTGALALMLGVTNVRAAEDPGVIAEIIVTAQKRSESVQDVPASVSAFDEQQLTRTHATQLQDFAAYLPGINVTSAGSPGQTTVTLRGIAPVGPGSVVGTYIDETPLGSSSNFARATIFALDLMPYDIERVEVLRGPQGTLYGAGAMGGLLKYVLRDPSTEVLEFRAGIEGFDITGADDLGWGARAGVNVPLSDTVALRASYFTQNTPGYVDNVAIGPLTRGGEDYNELEQSGGRASLLWEISDVASLTLTGVWQRLESDNNSTVALSLASADPLRARRDLGDLQTSHFIDQPFSKDLNYYAATLDWNLGWADFVSATSYSSTRTVQRQDGTITFGSLFPLLSGGAVPEGLSDFDIRLNLDKWTQELRLASSGQGRVQWRLGVFYTEEDSSNNQLVLGYDTQGQLVDAFLPALAIAHLPSEYKEIATFGDVTLRITDTFDIITGLRWARNDQKFRQVSSGFLLPLADIPGESDEDVFTYAISPRWHLNDDVMVYARVATGYRPGGPNIRVFDVPPSVDSDELTNYELGIKSVFAGGRALVNAALFYIDWEGIQQAQSFGGVSALSNSGDAKSKGVELESVFSLTNGLQIGFNASYTDAVLKSSPLELDNALNVQLPGVPEWTAALTADYSFKAFGGREAHIGAGWRFVDERYSEVVRTVNNLGFALPSYDVVDLNAQVQFDAMTLRLFVKNLTDERAFTGGSTTVNGLDQPIRFDLAVLQPRTVGVSVDFQF